MQGDQKKKLADDFAAEKEKKIKERDYTNDQVSKFESRGESIRNILSKYVNHSSVEFRLCLRFCPLMCEPSLDQLIQVLVLSIGVRQREDMVTIFDLIASGCKYELD